MKPSLIFLFSAFLIIQCGPSEVDQAADSITKDSILRHIETLSSDDFMGRGTGTEGDEMTVDYLVSELREIGTTPGVGDSSFVQPFPLLGQKISNAEMEVEINDNDTNYDYFDEFVAWASDQSERVDIDDAELVYVGYGIQAPEQNWDDFKGMDVSGKIIVIKNNDPAYDPDLFGGTARLYYGRWTYKFEKAKEMGALGAIVIHTTPTAGYGWNVVSNSWSRERFYVKASEGAEKSSTAFNAWITYETAREIFRGAGLDVDEMLDAADSPDFEPVPLNGVEMDVSLDANYRTIQAKNVIAKIEGNNPELKDEYLVLTAHFDHLGVTTPVNGDSINNGAEDNAAGVSAVLNLMRAYKEVQPQLKRSVLALLVGAEEVGLLGSEFWAQNPTVHPGKITANINLDGMNVYGETTDVVIIGYGRNTMSDLVEQKAEEMGRTVKPDPNPEQGIFYRSDHFNMAKVGIPAIFPNPGVNFVDKPENWSEVIDSVSAANYHSVSDEINDYWDLAGAVKDTRLFFRVGLEALNAADMQKWKKGDEFEAARLQMVEDVRN